MGAWKFRFLIGSLIVLLLWLISPYIVSFLSSSTYLPSISGGPAPATISDIFNVLNTLFTGVALSAIVVAIFIQTEQLELNRKELELANKRYEDDDKWLRLRLDMEMVPRICEKLENQIETLLKDRMEDYPIDFHKSALSIDHLKDRVGNRLLEFQREFQKLDKEVEEARRKHKEAQDAASTMTDDEIVNAMKRLQTEGWPQTLDGVMRETQFRRDQLQGQSDPFMKAEKMLIEMLALQDRLDSAYRKASLL
jgi:cell division protein FtsL